jgi:hypothetical protein
MPLSRQEYTLGSSLFTPTGALLPASYKIDYQSEYNKLSKGVGLIDKNQWTGRIDHYVVINELVEFEKYPVEVVQDFGKIIIDDSMEYTLN